jgi:hypothetical protein
LPGPTEGTIPESGSVAGAAPAERGSRSDGRGSLEEDPPRVFPSLVPKEECLDGLGCPRGARSPLDRVVCKRSSRRLCLPRFSAIFVGLCQCREWNSVFQSCCVKSASHRTASASSRGSSVMVCPIRLGARPSRRRRVYGPSRGIANLRRSVPAAITIATLSTASAGRGHDQPSRQARLRSSICRSQGRTVRRESNDQKSGLQRR